MVDILEGETIGRSPHETWAHYIKRSLGRDVFSGDGNRYNELEFYDDAVRLNSDFSSGGMYVSVTEKIDSEPPKRVDSLRSLSPYTQILIMRRDSVVGEPNTLEMEIYDDGVKIVEYDPAALSPHIMDSMRDCVRQEGMQNFVDLLVEGIRRFASGDATPRPRLSVG